MGAKAHGRILFWEGASLWLLSAPPGVRFPRTDVHAHHAVQVTLALTGRAQFDGPNTRVEGVAIAVAPDAPHAFQATGLVAHLFIASDGQAGREIARALFAREPLVALAPGLVGDLAARLQSTFEETPHGDEHLRALGRELVTTLAGHGASASADPRIEKVIQWASARLDQTVTLGDAGAFIGLSAGRTRHLFVQQTGLPFRTYVLWLRLMRALEAYTEGASLTDAAHAAGFSDSAHLSRTFRRMFGISAASLQVSEYELSAARPASGLRRRP